MGKPHGKPRRIVTRVMVFLLFGLVVNVAVAWGCSLRSARAPFNFGNMLDSWDLIHPTAADLSWLDDCGWQPTPEDDSFIYVPASRQISGFGLTRKAFFEWRRFKPGVTRGPFGGPMFAIWNRAGWPMAALYSEQWHAQGEPDGHYAGRYAVATVPISYRNPPSQRLIQDLRPLGALPLWPGFAINTIFYAAIIWVLCFVPCVLRRKRRLKRGLCIHCGYDLRALPVDSVKCPECGRAR